MSTEERPLEAEHEERLGELLRERLHREGDHVPVSDDALSRILARTGPSASRSGSSGSGTGGSEGRTAKAPWQQPRTWLAAAAAVVVVAGGAAVGLGALGGNDSSRAVTPAASGSPSSAVSGASGPTSGTGAPVSRSASAVPSSSATTAALPGVPVYWIGQQGTRLALFREFETLPVPASGRATASEAEQRLQAAVTAAVSGRPVDPDYEQVWAAGSSVTTQLASDLISINLNSSAAGSSLGSEAATLAVQQLVWTATAAVGQNLPVRITVNAEARDLFGVVSAARPFTRQTGTDDPRAAVWIDDPAQGTTVDSAFTARGTGVNAFENVLTWRVLDGTQVVRSGQLGVVGADGKPVDSGKRGSWSLPLTLPSGHYRLEVAVPDASGGASTVVRQDTKDFTVR